jgi:hypothetical protein
MADLGIDWDNLEGATVLALKYACQQLRIRPSGPLKKDLINALRASRPISSPVSPSLSQPNLSPLTTPQRLTGFADIQYGARIQQARASERLIEAKMFPLTQMPVSGPPLIPQSQNEEVVLSEVKSFSRSQSPSAGSASPTQESPRQSRSPSPVSRRSRVGSPAHRRGADVWVLIASGVVIVIALVVILFVHR